MDIVTQGVLGAALAATAAPPRELRAAALVGLAAGMLADADALIRSANDPLLTLEYHRHFSHALAFVPLGALLAAVLLWPLLRTRLAFRRLYLYSFLGYCLSGFLDACTSYGTHLLWPFSNARTAFNVIAIVDPVFTLALLVPLALALRRRRRAVAMVGIGLGALYLGVGVVQHHRALHALERVAEERGHRPQRMLVKPTFANLLLWRGLYVADGEVHAHAIRAGLVMRSYPGQRAALAEPAAHGPEARFATFADDWLIRHPGQPTRFDDARYAMLPTSLRPMWGLDVAGGTPRLVIDRSMSPAERSRFTGMLLGRPEP
jgi:inner membrane protein